MKVLESTVYQVLYALYKIFKQSIVFFPFLHTNFKIHILLELFIFFLFNACFLTYQ